MSNFEEEPPQKKRKEEDSLGACLTEDLVLNCLARASRLEHAALSLTSKSYRSLVASPDLYKIRSLMGRTETCVYVCLLTPPPFQYPLWYILRRRKTLDGSDLIRIPWLPSQPPEGSSVVVLDWGIYVIGGMLRGMKRTSDVWLLDCRTHTWRQVPSMGVARAYAVAGVVDGKIYVIGGFQTPNRKKWGEVFDPKTQTWDTLPLMPRREDGCGTLHDSVVRDQKVYAVDGQDRTYYYSASQGQWGLGNQGQVLGNRRDWCVIDDLIYFLTADGRIFWCEADQLDRREPAGMMDTKEVKGLGDLYRSLSRSRVVQVGEYWFHLWEETKFRRGMTLQKKTKFPYGTREELELEVLLPGARLSNSGGNLVLFWDVIVGDDLQIWCTEISLGRRQGGEIWGNIEVSNAVMTTVSFLGHYKELGGVWRVCFE